MSEIDEQTFKVIVRLFPNWVDEIEQDITHHHYNVVRKKITNDNVDNDIEGRGVQGRDGSTEATSLTTQKMDSDESRKLKSSDDLMDTSNCPDAEELSQKTQKNDRVDALALQVEILTSQMQHMGHALNTKDALILEMWTVLSREHFQFANTIADPGIEIVGSNKAVDLESTKISFDVKNETQQLGESEQNVGAEDASCLSLRQVRAQELDARIRESCQHFYCSRRSSLDILKAVTKW